MKKDIKKEIENTVNEKENFINKTPENIKIAFLLNLVFSIIEAIGGILTNSISIISDSLHNLGDSITIGINYIFEKKSKKLTNKDYSYGYLKYTMLGSLIASFVLLVGSVVIIYNVIPRLIKPLEVNYDAMIIFGIFGLLINLYATIKIMRSKEKDKKINTHMIEDTIIWLFILMGSICIKVFNLVIIDPVLSLLIAIYILYQVYKYMKNIYNIFMEKVPKNIKIDEIKKEIEENENIDKVHYIHIWSMDGINNYMTAHIHLNKNLSEEEIIKIKNDIKNKLKEYNISQITLEVEYFNEKCDSDKCKN